VFFNVYQGVREVSPVVLANARMLGASPRQLLRHVYVPSAMSWVFASLHNSVDLRSSERSSANIWLGKRRRLPHPSGGGLLRYEYRGRRILLLTAFALLSIGGGFGRKAPDGVAAANHRDGAKHDDGIGATQNGLTVSRADRYNSLLYRRGVEQSGQLVGLHNPKVIRFKYYPRNQHLLGCAGPPREAL